MAAEKSNQNILFISDTHRGGQNSNLVAYEENLKKKMAQYEHVVLAGDIFELFFPLRKHKHHKNKDIVKDNIKESIEWLRDFLDNNSNCHVHFILGNHENIERFRNRLEKLQQEYPNFEWDPDSIKIGDALITHGHLPLIGKTDKDLPPYRLRFVERARKAARTTSAFERLTNATISQRYAKEVIAPQIHEKLKEWDEEEKFFYTENKERKAFSLEGITNIFFGHTHHKFHNYAHTAGDKTYLYHNMGAITHETSKKDSDLGILEANFDGAQITKVRPVEIQRIKQITR